MADNQGLKEVVDVNLAPHTKNIGIKFCKVFANCLFFQNGDPTEPSLKSFGISFSKKRAAVVFRNAPFVVMVININLIGTRPVATIFCLHREFLKNFLYIRGLLSNYRQFIDKIL